MIAPRVHRLAAVSLIVYLTVPWCVGSSAQTQGAVRAPADGVGIAGTSAPTFVAESEPNNTSGTATSIAAPLTAARFLIAGATINPAGDVDFYTFTTTAASRVWIAADTGGTTGAGATSRDSVIDLLAFDGVTVIENDDDDGTGNGGDGVDESGNASIIAGRNLPSSGTYFIRVQAFSGASIINPYRLIVAITTATATAETEGNNTAELANAGVPNSASFGLRAASIGFAADVDYFAVAATAGSTIYYSADADPERDGAGTNLVVELRSPTDVLLHSVDSSSTGSLSNPAAEGSSFNIASDGVYFIKVRHFSVSGTGSYHLLTAVSVPSEDEPNDTVETAEPVVFSSPAQRSAIIAGTINPSGDVDFYAFQAAAGSRVWIETDTGGTQNAGASSRDTTIFLLASDGVTVIETDDDDGTGNGGDGTNETGLASVIAGRTLVTGGTYFLRVQAFSGTGIINPYKMLLVLTNKAASAEVEDNNTAGAADKLTTAAAPIGLVSGAIGSAGDADYYSLVVAPGSLVYFNVDADPDRDGTGTDLVLEFRSPADVILQTVDSSINGSLADAAAEGANFIVGDAGGTYYLKVRHFSGTGTGTYDIMAITATGNGSSGFTDSPVTATVSTIRAVHFTELRTRINTLRARFGLGAFGWSHPSLAGTIVDADDMTELRTALGQAYTAAGMTPPAFTDPALAPQGTTVRAVHIEQVRSAVIALESS